MNGPSLFVTHRQLPPGYSRTLGPPPEVPVRPKPAATLALLRRGEAGLEVLLLERSRRTRFLPGAHVFPGGRVDREDASPDLVRYIQGPTHDESEARHRAGLHPLPPIAYRVAAIRETFEEAGVFLGGDAEGVGSFPMEDGVGLGGLRRALHQGRRTFRSVLQATGRTLGTGKLTLIGHWVTPVQERYRYDTRFFGAEIPVGCTVFPDGIEMVRALWLTPADALHRNRIGTLPMVFPTIMTLQALEPFSQPRVALGALGEREIPRRLPTVEKGGDGVRMTLQV